MFRPVNSISLRETMFHSVVYNPTRTVAAKPRKTRVTHKFATEVW